MATTLEFQQRIFINFKDGTYRWVDIKCFSLQGVMDDQTALAMLLNDVRYRGHYAAADSSEQDSKTLHGPYRLDRISPDAFESVDAETAANTIRAWAGELGDLPKDVRESLDREIFVAIGAAANIYQLQHLGNEAFHDWGWVLGDFHELVLINKESGSLKLVVASDD